MNLNKYLRTYIIFSPWKPAKLKRRSGKQKEIKTKTFILIESNNKLTSKKIIPYQITFTKAVW